MAGDVSGFKPDEFRKGIRFVMGLGAPDDTGQQATFYFPRAATPADSTVDSEGVPFGPEQMTFSRARNPVRVPCAIEDPFTAGIATGEGPFGAGTIIVTLLDDDFDQVEGFVYVVVGGVRYDYRRELIPRGLGTVTVHRLVCVGEAGR